MKKRPAILYERQTGFKPFIGMLASESYMRRSNWGRHGCNAFDSSRPTSNPLSVWTEQDILRYLKEKSLPIAEVYGEIVEENGILKTTGLSRTGCMFCAFGVHLEKEPNKFQHMKQTHPKQWDYCMRPKEEGGLGMKAVLERIHVKTE